jgi:hypothetical protein
MEWQPIETVPMNTYVLVFMNGDMFKGKLEEEGIYKNWDFPFADAHGCGCCAGCKDYPTHWVPLPEPPVT